ncbi:8-amino-7-oxononanoate synthase [Candidatus Nitrospira inopinata]|jgi:glycine C-acetyltransferase/8-amino-7-oxononanoate synthase|uniref:8-amino-7-oxononanoate synthase n=1 Tax=Candidatus Nitrospira inopinata TaxID=1715989 RepID=A0A0S4KWN2_9BACT|nr:8-amino-7-oxononanoate synthase [Candidatus Nitrospira inopinata]CUQ67610.1 8-amino-7-oxononanoate synthase [Candidatus Nitrospira inopinata]
MSQDRFSANYRHRLDEALIRRLNTVESSTGPIVRYGGRPVILLSSNDYLGLAAHPSVIRAAVHATEQYGSGAGASRLICGTLPPHSELESALASFKGTEAALLFGSGYLANLGVIPALIGRDGLILADRLCHASLIDGCRLSGADFRVFRHRDADHLESLLKRRRSHRRTLIVTDGLFSMDGDLAPLAELASLAKRYDAALYVDDAHGTGVMGATGRGTLEALGVEDDIPFHMGTLGKALGSSGAYVVGSGEIIDYLLNTARSFMFTTAPPPATAAAARAAVTIIRQEPERRTRLWENQAWMLHGLRRLGFRLTETVSPILPVLIGDAATALAFAEQLLARGVYAPAVRPPTVPQGTSRIRITVTSEHTASHLEEALHAFESAGRALRLI